MAITLLEKAQQILEEKRTKVIPENIKEEVTIFGVEGSLNSGGMISEEEYTALLASANSILYDDIYREPLFYTFDSGMLESITFDANVSRIVDTSYRYVGKDSCLMRGIDKKLNNAEVEFYLYTWAYTSGEHSPFVESYNGIDIRDPGYAYGWYKDGIYWYVYKNGIVTLDDAKRYIDGVSVAARTTASDDGAWTGDRGNEEDDWLVDNEAPIV